jgi:hypothetical protein
MKTLTLALLLSLAGSVAAHAQIAAPRVGMAGPRLDQRAFEIPAGTQAALCRTRPTRACSGPSGARQPSARGPRGRRR